MSVNCDTSGIVAVTMIKHFHIAVRARVILIRGESEPVFLHSLIHVALIRLLERISLLASYECRGVTGERGDPRARERESPRKRLSLTRAKSLVTGRRALLRDRYIVELALNNYAPYFTACIRVPAVNTELPATT